MSQSEKSKCLSLDCDFYGTPETQFLCSKCHQESKVPDDAIWDKYIEQYQESFPDSIWDKYSEQTEKKYTISAEGNPFLEENNEDIDLLAEGTLSFIEGNLRRAINQLEAFIHTSPDHADLPLAWFYLSKSLVESDDDAQAILAVRNCIKLDPKYMKAYALLYASQTNEYSMDTKQTIQQFLENAETITYQDTYKESPYQAIIYAVVEVEEGDEYEALQIIKGCIYTQHVRNYPEACECFLVCF
eukprot:TRINITY_DN3031_c1_g1_i4.p1 TRINITY_DN3031_c1_g1~~TRINITY_DN3031_c1_g1_i4.p1  ORF type:complete len:280 (+),score=49.38 TRINITY_DN3031_c1_g1_i4:109-840(+)